MNGRRGPTLREAVERVVASDNCSGCGLCSTLSASITMELDERGYVRPVFAAADDHVDSGDARRDFEACCPGVAVTAHRDAPQRHPILGSSVSAWRAWSTDAEIRRAGSSGGVLTALSAWLVETGQASRVVGAAADPARPARTVPVHIAGRADAVRAAGSRYAPVGTAALFDPADPAEAFVGKPCEAYAARRLTQRRPGAEPPILLSFFCAGTPSQIGTEELVRSLDRDPARLTGLRYRGDGWPGEFVARGPDGSAARMSYEQSWGHLGAQLQDRCKICPDGTGGHADIAVGDLWDADENGYPVFVDGPGISVALARTTRGHRLLLAARDAGVLELEPVDLDEVAAVQPFQRLRRETLPGRLAGRRAAGRPVPRYRGFGLLRFALRRPRTNVRFARGSYRRARAAQDRASTT